MTWYILMFCSIIKHPIFFPMSKKRKQVTVDWFFLSEFKFSIFSLFRYFFFLENCQKTYQPVYEKQQINLERPYGLRSRNDRKPCCFITFPKIIIKHTLILQILYHLRDLSNTVGISQLFPTCGTYNYESAIYFANISYICFYERNTKEMHIFWVEWHGFIRYKQTGVVRYSISISFIITDIWDICKINGRFNQPS